ncbi:MAG: thioredoxin domain-containing protein, partial [Gammaproteobacteria bacterium]
MEHKTKRIILGVGMMGCSALMAGLFGPGPSVFAAKGAAQAKAADPAKEATMAMGFTAEGHPYRGDPKAAVVVEEYSDYLCPYCGRHFTDTLPALLEKYAAPGKIQYVYRDFPLAALHPTAARGHEAALCVGEQGAARFWAMHDALFEAQGEWSRLPDPAGFLRERAEKIGADLKTYDECLGSGRKKGAVEAGIAAGNALGFSGTPSFRFVRRASGEAYTLVGAQPVAAFDEWLGAVLAGKEPPKQPEPPKPELPAWAKPEGLAPDPAHPGLTASGDPYRGKPDAPLTVVEFSDFQCPAWRRHVLETQPVLDEKFVATGKVRWIFKHRPLREHAWATAAAAAAECAADQGQFWEMHHLLYEEQEQWATAEADKALPGLAAELKLDGARFTECFNGRQALERVVRDLYDAERVAPSTPTFFLISGDK